MKHNPIIIIGAGIGGLTAAVELSARGEDVLVIEAGPEVGGKMGRHVVDGVEFDTGPSVLTMPDVAADVFQSAGTSLAAEVELIQPDHAFEYIWPDGTRLPVHFAMADTLASIREALGPKAEREFEGFLDYTRGIWDAAAPNFVYGDAPTFGSAFKLGMTRFREVMKIDPMRSMMGAIESRVNDPRLRDVLARYATYNGSDPRSAPATLNCIAWVELGMGCYGVKGGMYELARAMARVATRHGAEFRFDSPVASIDAKGAIRGVTLTDGTRIATERVVCNADVAHLVGDLMPSLTSITAPKEPSMSGWNAVIKARRRERPAHAVLFPERAYLDEFVDIFDRNQPPTEPTVYICAQEKAHHRTGWDDHEPLFIMANAPAEPRRGASDPDSWALLEATMMKRLVDHGLIEPDDTIVWRRTPTQLASRFAGSRGSIYGAASNSQLAAFQRPPNQVPGVDGLVLASGSAHPGGGVPMCMLSGRAAARAI